MQRSRRISGHKLHIHRPALAGIGAAVCFVGVDECRYAAGDDIYVDAEVDEARPRDVGGTNAGAPKVQCFDDSLRQVARLGAKRLREDECEIRRPVAERGITRALERRLDGIRRAERPRRSRKLGAKQIRG